MKVHHWFNSGLWSVIVALLWSHATPLSAQLIQRLGHSQYYCARSVDRVYYIVRKPSRADRILSYYQLSKKLAGRTYELHRHMNSLRPLEPEGSEMARISRQLVFLRKLKLRARECKRQGPISNDLPFDPSNPPPIVDGNNPETINPTNNHPTSPIPTPRVYPDIDLMDIASLNGASIYAFDGTFLGIFSDDPVIPNSIANEDGVYGSDLSALSIFSDTSPYGSEFSNLSAFNETATNPPIVVFEGRAVAWLTLNSNLDPSIDPIDVLLWTLGLDVGDDEE